MANLYCLLIRKSSRGAILAELAITLPLVLLFLLMFIWIGVMLNARASLSDAMATAIRLGATRGDVYVLNRLTLPAVNTYLQTGLDALPPLEDPVNQVLFAGQSSTTNPAELLLRYDKIFLGVADNLTSERFPNYPFSDLNRAAIQQLPASYFYALIYINQAISASIGGEGKYPCLADGAQAWAPTYIRGNDDGPGCVSCRLLNPITLDAQPYTKTFLPNSQFAVECMYQPSDAFTKTLSAIFRLVGAGEFGLLSTTRVAAFIDGALLP